jgi:hypothetical protein
MIRKSVEELNMVTQTVEKLAPKTPEELRKTVEEVNAANRVFWDRQPAVMDRRLADPAVVETAAATILSEVDRVPVRDQIPFEVALERAERTREVFRAGLLRETAQRAGRAKKTDALQEVILEIVRRGPTITTKAVLDRLRARQAPGATIDEITETQISFARPKGTVGEAPISGLKDRVSRAKREMRQRRGGD